MDYFENINIKNELKNELEQTSMPDDLIIKKLKEACNDKFLRIFTQNNYPQDDFTNNLIQHELGFKYAWSAKSNYHYFVSNLGRLILVKWENPNKKDTLKNEIFEYLHWFFKFNENGHDILNNPPLNINYNKHTDLYEFVASAWLKDEYKKDYDCHHINNDPNDNRTVNLIYLPKHIHQAI